MFPDLLLNYDNFGFEVRFAPGVVTSHIQVESVEMGEGRKRNEFANVKRNNVNQVWNAAENRIDAPPFLVPQIFRLI